MLLECSIRNLAVIEAVHVHFREGFHVLTGETGAGKSMIIDALSLIIGGRGSSELVRHGAAKAEIECIFELGSNHPVWEILQKNGYEQTDDYQLLLRREITAQGKSISRINGRLANLSLLKAIGEHLVNIHGQHEHQTLLNTEKHLEWLDSYAGEKITPLLHDYKTLYSRYQSLQRELNERINAGKEALQMADLYKFQLEEIASASIQPEEDVYLEQEKQKLAYAEKLYALVSTAYEKINDVGLVAVGDAMKRIEDAASYDPAKLRSIAEQVQNAFYVLEDGAFQLRDYRDQIEFNPERLQEVHQRLDQLAHLKRKYGNTTDEILAYADKIKRQLEVLDNKEDKIKELQQEVERLQAELMEKAKAISFIRKEAAAHLSAEMESELTDLQMKQVRFQVELVQQPHQLTVNGMDRAAFLISPNPGEPLRPLHKIASGGELSRIMLALQSIFAQNALIPVLVFDEVDTGVSGRAAQAIAEKLSKLASNCQVFSITHLPQVACMADVHFEIRKETVHARTFTVVQPLNQEQRIKELSRMLGGVQVTETTEHHAKEMLDMAEYKKEKRNHLQ